MPVPAPVPVNQEPQQVVVDHAESQFLIAADEGTADTTPASNGAGPPLPGVTLEYADAPAPAYPRDALREGVEGVVMLQVLVDVDGRPLQVDIQRSSGDRRLDNAARKQVLQALALPRGDEGRTRGAGDRAGADRVQPAVTTSSAARGTGSCAAACAQAAVIRMVRQHRRRAIQLFGDQQPHQHVRQGERAERPGFVGARRSPRRHGLPGRRSGTRGPDPARASVRGAGRVARTSTAGRGPSSATTCAPFGSAASTRAPSSEVARAASRPLPRRPGSISTDPAAASATVASGIRRIPRATHAGARSPTAISRAFIVQRPGAPGRWPGDAQKRFSAAVSNSGGWSPTVHRRSSA